MTDEQVADPRLRHVAVDLVTGAGGPKIDAAVRLAEELVAQEQVDSAATVAVACLPRGSLRAEAEPLIRDMLAEHGLVIPSSDDGGGVFDLLLRAFAYSDLHVAEFFGPFINRLPARDHQTVLQQRLVSMFLELDRATQPGDQRTIVEEMRAVIRDALS